MRLFLGVVVASVAVGYVLGGRLGNLRGLHLRWWALAPLGLAMQWAPLPWSGDTARNVAVGLLIASYPVLVAFASGTCASRGSPSS